MRGRKHINIPEGNEQLKPNDLIWLLGDAKDLENFNFYCNESGLLQTLEKPALTLKDYIAGQSDATVGEQIYCCAVKVAEVPRYVGKICVIPLCGRIGVVSCWGWSATCCQLLILGRI